MLKIKYNAFKTERYVHCTRHRFSLFSSTKYSKNFRRGASFDGYIGGPQIVLGRAGNWPPEGRNLTQSDPMYIYNNIIISYGAKNEEIFYSSSQGKI